jgi:general secretion pathway protein N
MKRALLLIVLGLLVFAGIIIARLPASWVMPDAKSGVACADIDGTIWNGTCTGLTVQQQAIGDLSWELHASRLLAAKLNAAVVLTRPSGISHATVEIGLDKNITARDIRVDMPLDQQLMPQLPPNLHGTVHADLALVRVEKGAIKALQGNVEAHDLVDGAGSAAHALGSYSLSFPAAEGNPVGKLRDLGGPLQVDGTFTLTPEPGYILQGFVTPRATAAPDLVREIQILGSPDAQGRRPFGLEGAF